jgi:hypothetical protein
MIFLGADPDLHTLSIAACNDKDHVVDVIVIKNDKELKGRPAAVEMISRMVTFAYQLPSFSDHTRIAAMAVESQEISYTAQSGANPGDLLTIAPISGALVFLGHCCGVGEVYLPAPQKWKGSVRKVIHQARVFQKLGWEYETKSGYCCPVSWEDKDMRFCECVNGNLNKGDWKHITDSIGLAMYAKETFFKHRHKQMVLARAGKI